MSEFEYKVMEKLGVLEERTKDLPEMRKDISDIKGRLRLQEFKSSAFGAAAGAIIVGLKAYFGRN